MADRPSPWSRFRDLPNESPWKAIIVTVAVCLIGSILVSATAVLLKPRQLANQERERLGRIVEIVGQVPGAADRLEARVVDLATGDYAPRIDPRGFDAGKAAADPALGVAIPAARDIAGIGRRARHAVVYLVEQDGRPRLVILPVHGKGFASTLYGYLGLSGDASTVAGLAFYRHGETPGLGALIDSPDWRHQWRGKKVWDTAGRPRLGVARGAVDPSSPGAQFEVDGLTGATWTSQGVTNLIRFWLGDDGFGRYLQNLRRQGG